MNIYDAINEIIVVKKYGLSASLFMDAKREMLDSEEEKRLFDLLKDISSLGSEVTKNGIEFCPHMRWENDRTFAIEDLLEEDYNRLKSMDIFLLPLNLAARIAEILWIHKRDHEMAVLAVKMNCDFFNKVFRDEDWLGTLDIIKRAISISSQINNKELYNDCCQIVYNHVLRINGEDNDFLTIALIEIIISQSYGDMNALQGILDKIISRNSKNIARIERAYDLKIKVLKIIKDNAAIKKTNIERAELYVDLSEKEMHTNIQGMFRAENYLRKAITLYRNNGEAEKAESVHKRLIDVQREIPQLMIPYTTEVDISKIVANINMNMDGLTFAECLVRVIQMTELYKREKFKKKIVDDYTDNPVSQWFTRNMINNNGQTVLVLKPLSREDPEKDVELLNMHIFQKMLQHQSIMGDMYLKYALFHIRELHEFKSEDLDFLVKDNPIIPSGRENIFRSALYMVLKGDYYEGIHILAPQVECLFRNIAKEVGGLTITLENDGTSKEKVLSSIFDLPELMECYDNDILFLFKGLLNEKAGANIRNEVAHGILDEGSAGRGYCLYFICAVIKLLSLTSIECYKILQSEKIKNYILIEN